VKHRTTAIVLTLVSVAALATADALYRAHRALQETQARLIAATLQPIAALLTENRGIVIELEAAPFVEADNGSLESLLKKLRRDGVTKSAAMKQRLDMLAENNTAIATLIKVYLPFAITPAFAAESDKFRNYTSAWRDRYNSVMELFMAGGNFPAAEPVFPAEFSDTVRAEIAAAGR
jgi:hypothetical protein